MGIGYGFGEVVGAISDSIDKNEKRNIATEDRALKRQVVEQDLETKKYGLNRSKVNATQQDEDYAHKQSRQVGNDEYQDYTRKNQKKRDKVSLQQSQATLQGTNLSNKRKYNEIGAAAKKADLKTAIEHVFTGNLKDAAKHINTRMKANIDPNTVTFDHKTGVLGFKTKDGQTGSIYIKQLASMGGIKIGKDVESGKWRMSGNVIYNDKTGDNKIVKGVNGKGRKGYGVSGNVVINKDTGETRTLKGNGKGIGKESSKIQTAKWLLKNVPGLKPRQAYTLANTTMADPATAVVKIYESSKKAEMLKRKKDKLTDAQLMNNAKKMYKQLKQELMSDSSVKQSDKKLKRPSSNLGKHSHLWK